MCPSLFVWHVTTSRKPSWSSPKATLLSPSECLLLEPQGTSPYLWAEKDLDVPGTAVISVERRGEKAQFSGVHRPVRCFASLSSPELLTILHPSSRPTGWPRRHVLTPLCKASSVSPPATQLASWTSAGPPDIHEQPLRLGTLRRARWELLFLQTSCSPARPRQTRSSPPCRRQNPLQ